MKSLFQVMVLVVVFVISSGVAQYIGVKIPGTPTQLLDTFLENSSDGVKTLDRLNSEIGRSLVAANSNWILLVYWPIACIATSLLARVLRVPTALVLGVIAILLIIQLFLMGMNAYYFEEFSSAVGRPLSGAGSPWSTIVSSFILCMALSATITLYKRVFRQYLSNVEEVRIHEAEDM